MLLSLIIDHCLLSTFYLQFAIKILPHVIPVQPIPGSPNAKVAAKQATKGRHASKEIHAIREAALSQLAVALPSIHMRHVRDDHPSTPLFH